jgi:hypothetical protein
MASEFGEKKIFLRNPRDHLFSPPEGVFANVHGPFVGEGLYRNLDVTVFIRPDGAGPGDDFDSAVQLSVDQTRELGRDLVGKNV